MTLSRYFICLTLMLCSALIFAQSKNPGFSLHNKSKNTIGVEVRNGVNIYKKNNLGPDEFFEPRIDISKRTSFTIFNEKGEMLALTLVNIQGKTVYINWNDEHEPRIYPQRGPLWGFWKETDKGHSTENNVEQKDLRGDT